MQIKDENTVSATCQLVTRWDGDQIAEQCGEPTAWWYPAQRGTMALCDKHAEPHRTLSADASYLKQYVVRP